MIIAHSGPQSITLQLSALSASASPSQQPGLLLPAWPAPIASSSLRLGLAYSTIGQRLSAVQLLNNIPKLNRLLPALPTNPPTPLSAVPPSVQRPSYPASRRPLPPQRLASCIASYTQLHRFSLLLPSCSELRGQSCRKSHPATHLPLYVHQSAAVRRAHKAGPDTHIVHPYHLKTGFSLRTIPCSMTVMADYASYQQQHQQQLPHRRPVAAPAIHTVTKTIAGNPPSQPSPTHYHSRTASSAIFPTGPPNTSAYSEKQLPAMPQQQQPQQYAPRPPQQQQQQQYQQLQQQPQQQYAPHPSRRLTNSTVSSRDSVDQRPYTSSTSTYAQPYSTTSQQTLPVRASESNLRRSTSSRSQASSLGPSSYVALLRKQKATVWCERTQPMDPRVQMQAKAARARAANEILKSNMGRASISANAPSVHSSGGMLSRNKNKQGRTTTSGGGAGANLVAGVGVPMRLSASEVGDEEEDEEDGVYSGGGGGAHRRSGSGRSSLGAPNNGQLNRLAAPRTNTRLSYGSSKPGSSTSHTPPGGTQTMTSEISVPATLEHTNSFGSAGSEERREKEMGDVGDLDAPKAVETQEKKFSKDELSRRGSVDERSATMRGAAGAMRLFVANPDASDSD